MRHWERFTREFKLQAVRLLMKGGARKFDSDHNSSQAASFGQSGQRPSEACDSLRGLLCLRKASIRGRVIANDNR